MRRIDHLWWPDHDVECHRAIGFLDDLRRALEFVPVEKRSVCLQAGGNMGVWANYLAPLFGEVWTVEPRLENYLCLVRNIAHANIRPIWAALGEKPGTTGIWCNPVNAGSPRVEGEGRVPIITIDELQIAPSFMTLDIEGYEPIAVQGAQETIARCKPVLLVEDRGHSKKYGFNVEWTADIPGYRRKKLQRDTLLIPC